MKFLLILINFKQKFKIRMNMENRDIAHCENKASYTRLIDGQRCTIDLSIFNDGYIYIEIVDIRSKEKFVYNENSANIENLTRGYKMEMNSKDFYDLIISALEDPTGNIYSCQYTMNDNQFISMKVTLCISSKHKKDIIREFIVHLYKKEQKDIDRIILMRDDIDRDKTFIFDIKEKIDNFHSMINELYSAQNRFNNFMENAKSDIIKNRDRLNDYIQATQLDISAVKGSITDNCEYFNKFEQTIKTDISNKADKLDLVDLNKSNEATKLELVSINKLMNMTKSELINLKQEFTKLTCQNNIVHIEVFKDSDRRKCSDPVINISFNKQKIYSTLLIEANLCVRGNGSPYDLKQNICQIWTYGGLKTFGQSVHQDEDGGNRTISCMCKIDTHMTGLHQLTLSFSNGIPFIIINPNEIDHSNMRNTPTCSIIKVTEYL